MYIELLSGSDLDKVMHLQQVVAMIIHLHVVSQNRMANVNDFTFSRLPIFKIRLNKSSHFICADLQVHF